MTMIEISPNFTHMTLLSRWQCQFKDANNLMGVARVSQSKNNSIDGGIN